MSTNELDRLIANNVSRVSYEYDAGDWEKLTTQLDAARRKKRALLFTYCSSGIAASVAIFLIGIALFRSEKEVPAMSYASRPHISQPTPSVPVNNSVNIQPPGTRSARPSTSSAVFFYKKQAHPVPDTVTYNAPIVVYNELPVNTAIPSAKTQTATPGFEQKIGRRSYEEPLSLPYTETEHKADNRGINISVTGGVNYGTINTGYAVGAAVDKKLGNRFSVELTVAYVGNTTSTSGSQGTGVFLPPSPVPVVTSPLNYLQFAPMAAYSLSEKITLSAGADLQKLLQQHDVAVWYDDNIRMVPQIDLGMLLRTEYAVFPRLKAGLSYRFGANNIVAPGNNYFERNYMQLQLKYKLH